MYCVTFPLLLIWFVTALLLQAGPAGAEADARPAEEERAVPVISQGVYIRGLPVIAEDDPDYAIAYAVMRDMSRPVEGRESRIVFQPPYRIAGPALEKLLPGYRFMLLDWATVTMPEDREPLSRTTIEYILIVSPGTEHQSSGVRGHPCARANRSSRCRGCPPDLGVVLHI
jgi:hypothetical protein